ncbi:hypothetical protein [Lysobacter gummosus]|uniref:hypothetical protein n=1 Tax=Lysobacter gummosus TaxID=262324 RepID=UPI0036434294
MYDSAVSDRGRRTGSARDAALRREKRLNTASRAIARARGGPEPARGRGGALPDLPVRARQPQPSTNG